MKKSSKHKITNYRKFFRSTFILIVLLSLLIFSIFKLTNKINHTEQTASSSVSNNNTIETNNSQDISIKMTVIGDIMCHNTQYIDAQKDSNTYDFSYVFSEIKDKLTNNDICIGNLETTFAGSKVGYTSYPTFNTPEVLGQNLKDVGIDVLSTANNHCLDKGYKGIESTINFLDSFGLDHMGTYKSEEEQNKVLIKDVKGIKIAFLSYTYGTNGIHIPKDKPYSVNLIDKDLILKHINYAKEQGVDLICANMHWGIEYKLSPNNEQKDLSDYLFKNGIDIIFGSHPHVLEPMEIRNVTTNQGENKQCFVIYSLGNFISGQVKENTKNSIILDLSLTKHTEGYISIDKVEYTPIYCFSNSSKPKNYKVLDIRKSISEYEAGNKNISNSTYNTLKKELIKIDNLMKM